MTETDKVLLAVEELRKESKSDLNKLTDAMAGVANAQAELTTTVARIEERHASQNTQIAVLFQRDEKKDERIRKLELVSSQRGAFFKGGWKGITITAACLTGAAGTIATILEVAP